MNKPYGRHEDWPWPFRWIRREWHSFSWKRRPVKILGNTEKGDHLDIPKPGKWVIAGVGWIPIPVFFAIQTKNRRYLRIALIRYDYEDKYYTIFSFAYRNYNK